ncbi:MAG: NAD(P)/FAD-dependent oxidoreductase [Myxococcota bacterium]
MRDVAVVGAGFGGLGTALTLAEAGADVVLFEQLRYAGGCASTFTRGGRRYESGATLFSGFGPGQLMRRWIDRHGLDVPFEALDPLVELRTPDFTLAVPPSREAFLDRLVALEGVPEGPTRRFFALQERSADTLWSLLASPELLPPFDLRALLTHARRVPRYLPLLGQVGRPLDTLLRRHGLGDCAPLRAVLDAVCQITVQAGVDEVEAPFALGAMDYYFRGTGHVHGGVGVLAEALVQAVRTQGGDVRMPDGVKSLRPDDAADNRGGWVVTSRKGVTRARTVVLNLLPQAARRLLGADPGAFPRLDTLATRVEGGWGAAMLYLTLGPGALRRQEAHHLELVVDPAAPFTEGNHLFVSIGGTDEGKAAAGERTVTVSTHVPMARLRALPDAAQGAFIGEIQERMRRGLAARAPEVDAGIVHAMTGSPRTFARFTGRDFGYVGGVPRRAGLASYAGLWPRPVAPNLHLVGDTVFPGQSTLATALGGVKLAERLVKRLGTPRKRLPAVTEAPSDDARLAAE